MAKDVLTVVPAGLPHGAVMAGIHRACFDAGWPEPEITGLLSAPRSGAALILANGCAEDPIGFLLYRCAADECEILTLCVLPGDRRRGAATRLLEFLETEISERGVSAIFLEVDATNFAAISLYQRTGFEQTGRRKSYYVTPAGRRDALIFTRQLGNSRDFP